MPLSATDIFNKLSDWPHRGFGSEEEMEAREALMAELSGEIGVEVTEEGFTAPKTYLTFFWIVALGQALMILAAPLAPVAFVLGGLMLLVSHLLYFDWRVSPLAWAGDRTLGANLVAKKGVGRRLIILMAHLDSAPASFAYRPDQVRHFALSVWLGTGIVTFGLLVPLAVAVGIGVPLWLRVFFGFLLVAQAGVASWDYLRHGFTPGGNDNLSGVACATAVASRLWHNMPADTEVRLVITSAEEAGMLGAQHYWRQHRGELHGYQTHILNIDTVGAGKLAYVTESGGFTKVYYGGPLIKAAGALARLNERFKGFQPARHHVGDFDSVWFARDDISALTLAAYDEDGLMPHIHTPKDMPDRVDLRCIEEAADCAEALLRLLPKALEKQEKKL